MARIDIEIDENGEVRCEVFDIEGPACEKLTKELMASIGQVKTVEKKREYHVKAPATRQAVR